MPPEPTKAVFLSYAREDTEAARRIAEALRGFGVEVWFDQSELRGGDQWDAKIRRQIRECALFLPVVSAHTEERSEGYFRREWLLAVERTRDMAAGKAFIMPVVVDNTSESGTEVPEEFMRYQWTRLANGEPTPEFVAQVKRLLEVPKKPALKPDLPRPPTLPPQFKQTTQAQVAAEAAAAKSKPIIPGWMWGVAAAIIVAVGVGLVVTRQPGPANVPVANPAVPKSIAPAAPAAPAVSDKSIAVLPFENRSDDKANAFFTDGIHEDILTNLAHIAALRVVSRTSVMEYRGTTKKIRQIGQELGVAWLLEGSVQRQGNKVRVTGQLINARTDEHVWAQSYDRDLTDLFAIQAELAQEIAGALKAALSPEEQTLLARRPTTIPAAYDLFLKAREINRNGNDTREELENQEALLKSAVTLDPTSARIWAELATVHASLIFTFFDASAARLAKARAAIERAQQLEPDSPDVIGGLGTYYYCSKAWG